MTLAVCRNFVFSPALPTIQIGIGERATEANILRYEEQKGVMHMTHNAIRKAIDMLGRTRQLLTQS